ncbi:MAG: glycerol acyltransferase [Proteobacteria bacterium]|nr:MAG: glycerol acyltransferase [Pseudomonadota bacterium]
MSDDERDAPATPALADALVGLRQRLEQSFAPPEEGGIDWMALYESARRRFAQVGGMRDIPAEIDDFGMDAAALADARTWLDWLYDRWWRVDVVGSENVPSGPCLFVANHSGLLPWDGLMLAHALDRHTPESPRARFLVADWIATLPFAAPWITRLGGVRACRENAERLLRTGRSVIAFPEGAKGAAKVFRQRYRVQRFGRGGVVRTALAARRPLVPVAVVGAEEAHPVLFKVETVARSIGIPFLPVTPTFPALGPLGLLPLPSKWSIEFGAPVDASDIGRDALRDDTLIWRVTEELRSSIQSMLDAGVRRRSSVWS